MARHKIPDRRFKDGEIVDYSVYGISGSGRIIDARWNGQTYMYSIEDAGMRCGEMYLKRKQSNNEQTDKLDKGE